MGKGVNTKLKWSSRKGPPVKSQRVSLNMDHLLPKNTAARKQSSVDVTVVDQGEVNVGSVDADAIRFHEHSKSGTRKTIAVNNQQMRIKVTLTWVDLYLHSSDLLRLSNNRHVDQFPHLGGSLGKAMPQPLSYYNLSHLRI